MNNIMLIGRYLLMTLFLLSSFSSFAASTVNATFPVHSEEDYLVLDRLNNLSSIIDFRYTQEVKDRINNYIHEYPKGSQKILGRVSLYFPLIENKLREKNLPDDLKYLAVVESALVADASSRSGAKGLWQFMKGTGKMYGLTINAHVDERKDPLKSTDAALDYLSDLYDQFDDWTMALAAYNCGPGNVRKAIRKSGGKRTYWEIRDFLPRETREYIPRQIAAIYLMQYYYMHDIEPSIMEENIINTSTSRTYKQMSFKDISASTGVSLEDIKFLNPSYLRNVIPASVGENYLTLPSLKMSEYLNTLGRHEDLMHRIENRRFVSSEDIHHFQRMERIEKYLKQLDIEEQFIVFERTNVPLNNRIKIYPMITDLLPEFKM